MNCLMHHIIGTHLYTGCPSYEISKQHKLLQVWDSFFLIKLHWYQNKAKTNRFLTSNQSFNAGGVPLQKKKVSVLPRVISLTLCLHLFQALADVLRINRTIEILALDQNQIGNEGLKVWWVEQCGVSPCVRVDSCYVECLFKKPTKKRFLFCHESCA